MSVPVLDVTKGIGSIWTIRADLGFLERCEESFLPKKGDEVFLKL